MTTEERLITIARNAAQRLGSIAELGRYLGVSRQQAHRITTGENEPTGAQLVKMQDLLKKVACALLVLGGQLSAPQDTSAFDSGRIPAPTYYTFRPIRRLRRLLQQVVQNLVQLTLGHPAHPQTLRFQS